MGKSKNKKDDFPMSKKMIKGLERDIEIERDKVQLIQSRFEEMKALLAQGDELSPPEDNLSGSKSHQLQPLPWLDNVPPTVGSKSLTGAVEYAIECIRLSAQIGYDDGDKVAINLTGDFLNDNGPSPRDFDKTVIKVQTWDGTKYPLHRMGVRIQFAPTIVRYLYINEEDFYSAMLYVDGKYSVDNADMEAYLLFEMEPGEIYYVEPEELCVLAFTGKSEKGETGVFTLFKKKHGILNDMLVIASIEGSPDLSQAEIDLSRYTPSLTATLRTKKRGRPPKAKATAPEITSPAEPEEEFAGGTLPAWEAPEPEDDEFAGSDETEPSLINGDGAGGDGTQSDPDTASIEEAEPNQAEPTPTTSGDGMEDSDITG